MRRLHLLLCIALCNLCQPVTGQQPAPADAACGQQQCPHVHLLPISGRVLDAVTGQPIAQATIHFRGIGNTFDAHHTVINPTSLQGEVLTAADGTYSLPATIHGGHFRIRASAPGYITAASFNFARAPEKGPQPAWWQPPDGIFRLQPDTAHLTSMSTAALAAFALPGGTGNREDLAASFSPTGDAIALLTYDSVGHPTAPPDRTCTLWIYQLTQPQPSASGLTRVPVTESLCQNGTQLFWQQNTLHLRTSADHLQWQTFLLHDATLEPAPDMPPPPSPAAAFLVDWDDGSKGCSSLKVTSLRTHTSFTATQSCGNDSFLFDPAASLLFFPQPGTQQPQPKPDAIVALDLRTRRRQSVSIPSLSIGGHLLDQHRLPDGTYRIAYATNGDCNPAEVDGAQPLAPAGELGYSPNTSSICFITLQPPPDLPASATSRYSSPR